MKPATTLALCLATSLTPLAAAATTYQNPILPGNLADPAVLRHEGTYYLYATGEVNGDNGTRAYTSTNLVDWQRGPVVFRPGQPHVWAPDVWRDPASGRFYLYYTVNQTVGVADADGPLGPFTIRRKFFDQAIDAHLFRDDDGKLYLYFVQLPGFRITVQTMASPTEPIGEPKVILQPQADWETRAGHVTEGPWIIKHTNRYYLLYSGSGADTPDYAVGYATADSPSGPFTRAPNNPIIQRSEGIYGPGHGCAIQDPAGHWWHIYHQKRTDRIEWDRFIALDPLWFDANGTLRSRTTRGTAQPAPAAHNPPGASARNLTFVLTSDSHYDAFENEDRNHRVRDTLQAINAVTNLAWPDSLGGGPIPQPRGLLLLGDVIDDGDRIFNGKHQTPRQYRLFLADFGFDGTDGLLNLPVFETWGNHDGPPPGREKFGFSFQAGLKERNQRRHQRGWLTNLSTNALHYSWDWDDVHFVSLGIYPADQQHPDIRYSRTWHDPQGALSFLKTDLAQHVGDSRRPVVLLSHCGFDTDWWHTNDWRAFYDAARDYHVLFYAYGHSGTGLRQWAPDRELPPWQCLNTGQTEIGFFLVRITADRLQAAYRVKDWTSTKRPGRPPEIHWDGDWKWLHLLDKPLPSNGR